MDSGSSAIGVDAWGGERRWDGDDWPHAPSHRLGEAGAYIVTASTHGRARLFNNPEKLQLVQTRLIALTRESNWQLEAWAVFANHYHFIVTGLPERNRLRHLIRRLHGYTAQKLNQLDGVSGRPVWYNFWDTHLTFQRSYLARLNCVHQNPVKHGLVKVASRYPWCSAAWFEHVSSPAIVRVVYSFKTDGVKVRDHF